MPVNFLYWDSCVFLSYINCHPERYETIRSCLEEIEKDNGRKIVTSAITKAEVAYASFEKDAKALDVEVIREIDNLLNDYNVIELVTVNDTITVRARNLMRAALPFGWSLKPIDAIHLASAEWAGAVEVHTYEPKWAKYGEFINTPILEPYVNQPRLLDT